MSLNAKEYIFFDRQRNSVRYVRRYLYCLRSAADSNCRIKRILCQYLLSYYRTKYGLEISPLTKIGKGLYLGHAFNITINPDVVLGDYCSLHKGCVLGQENRGKRKGSPIIGNYVWIGINAAIVGKVSIGDDVLIAPNTFVNCDIPPHSIVYGNPCIIKNRMNATEGYISI